MSEADFRSYLDGRISGEEYAARDRADLARRLKPDDPDEQLDAHDELIGRIEAEEEDIDGPSQWLLDLARDS